MTQRPTELDLVNTSVTEIIFELEDMLEDGRISVADYKKLCGLPFRWRRVLSRTERCAISERVAIQTLRLGYTHAPDKNLRAVIEQHRRIRLMYHRKADGSTALEMQPSREKSEGEGSVASGQK